MTCSECPKEIDPANRRLVCSPECKLAKRRRLEREKYQDPEAREAKREASRARYHRDPQRHREGVKRYRAANSDRIREQRIKIWYGLEPEQYQTLLARQEGVCAICKGEFQKTPHVDHDHETMAVRGLLCDACNHGLGKFADSVERLGSAITYLQQDRAEAYIVPVDAGVIRYR